MLSDKEVSSFIEKIYSSENNNDILYKNNNDGLNVPKMQSEALKQKVRAETKARLSKTMENKFKE